MATLDEGTTRKAMTCEYDKLLNNCNNILYYFGCCYIFKFLLNKKKQSKEVFDYLWNNHLHLLLVI